VPPPPGQQPGQPPRRQRSPGQQPGPPPPPLEQQPQQPGPKPAQEQPGPAPGPAPGPPPPLRQPEQQPEGPTGGRRRRHRAGASPEVSPRYFKDNNNNIHGQKSGSFVIRRRKRAGPTPRPAPDPRQTHATNAKCLYLEYLFPGEEEHAF